MTAVGPSRPFRALPTWIAIGALRTSNLAQKSLVPRRPSAVPEPTSVRPTAAARAAGRDGGLGISPFFSCGEYRELAGGVRLLQSIG